MEEGPAAVHAAAEAQAAPKKSRASLEGTLSFINKLDTTPLPKECGYSLQLLGAVGMEKLQFYLLGKEPQPVELELSKEGAEKSTSLTLEGGKVVLKLAYVGKNDETNAYEVDYTVDFEKVEKARRGSGLGPFARKAGAGFVKYLPHTVVATAGVALAALGLESEFIRTALQGWTYPAVGAVFVAIETLTGFSIASRAKELRAKEMKESQG